MWSKSFILIFYIYLSHVIIYAVDCDALRNNCKQEEVSNSSTDEGLCTFCETTLESPLNIHPTDLPVQSAFRDMNIFDPEDNIDLQETTESGERIEESEMTADNTETSPSVDVVKGGNTLLQNALAEFKTKKRNDGDGNEVTTETRRIVQPIAPLTIVFPPVPRGDLYRIQNIGLDEGFFPFTFISSFLPYLQSTIYPIELARDALLQKISAIQLITQSVSYEPGTITMLTLGIMLGVGTPLLLLGLCCAALMKRCGDRDKTEDPGVDCNSDGGSLRSENCKRRGLVFIMFLVLFLVAAGVLGTLAANEQVGNAAVRAPNVLDTALKDVITFLRNSHMQVRFLITNAIDKTLDATISDLNNVESLLGRPVQREIAAETGVDVALNLLLDISTSAQVLSEKCVMLQQSAGAARQLARSTQERLFELRSQIDTVKRNCPNRDRPLCDTLDTTGLEVAVTFDKVLADPRLTQLRRIHNDSLSTLIQRARAEFQFVPDRMEADTRDARIGLRRQLEMERAELYELLVPLDKLSSHIENRVERIRDTASRYLEPVSDMEHWRWLICLCAGLTVFLLWLILVLAVVCGCCDAEKHASCAIVTAFVLLALLSTVLWTIALSIFVLGSRFELLVSRPLREEPHFTELTALFDATPMLYGSRKPGGLLAKLAYDNDTLNVPLHQVLTQCRDNRQTYTTLQLSRVFDAEHACVHQAWSGYHAQLMRLSIQDLRQLHILSPELAHKLNALLDSTSVDLASLRNQLSGHVTNRDLRSFATQLENVGGQIRDSNTEARLESLVARTRRMLTNIVQPLEKQKDQLVYQMTSLEIQLVPLQKQVNQSLSHLKAIQYFITNQGSNITQEKASQYAARLLHYAQQFQDYVLQSIEGPGPVASCRPIWNIFLAIRLFTCDNIADPLNGLWFSLMFCMLMLIFTIPIGLSLISQYNRSNRSTGLLSRTTENQDSPPTSDAWTSNADNHHENGSQRW